MGASLLSGVSGLRAHQQLLDVVANNLANVNTSGFKASRLRFSDQFAQTLQTSTAPSSATGGTNPIQIGLGVQSAGIDADMSQGSLSATGRAFDMAIQGNGFFVVNSGVQDFYTRVGAFDVDADNSLVDLGTGFRVRDVNGADITIPYNETRPGQATALIDIVGNLNATAANPAAEVLTTSAPFEMRQATLAGTAAGPTWAIDDGETFDMSVDNAVPATTVTFNVAVNGAATQTEVLNALNAVVGLTATARDGVIVVKSDETGATSSLEITDGAGTPAAALGLSTSVADKSVSGTTDLRDLSTTSVAYVDGDTISILGTDYGDLTVNATFTFGSGNDGTTLASLVGTIDAGYTASTAALTAGGDITLTAGTEGDGSLVMVLDNASGTGSTSWASHMLRVTTAGSSGATRTTSTTIYDGLGSPHVLSATFRKQGDNTWGIEASCDDGTMTDRYVEDITFNDDGSFNGVSGTGEGDRGIAIQFAGISGQQNLFFNLGESGATTNLTQFGGLSSATAIDQNGFGSGSLSSVSVRPDGVIQGNFTNGEIIDIAQLQIATFSNPAGLSRQGDNFYLATTNSGAPITGGGQQGGAGMVAANTLEGSNVDTALEFTRMITAQRGFQVNARVITTADQVLQEMANIIR